MLHAVILAGGSGTRFWPLSRRDLPKQFIPILGSKSLLRQTVERVSAEISPERTWVVTSEALCERTREELPELAPARVLAEPAPRGTAAAIGLAAARLRAIDPEATMLIMPADHFIEPASEFLRAIDAATTLLRAIPDALVLFGIPPTYPATGYGYIEREAVAVESFPAAARVVAFREKPDRATAEEFLRTGKFVWNSGIFLWRAERILAWLTRLLPQTADAVLSLGNGTGAEGEDDASRRYASLSVESIDRGVLEKADQRVVLAASFQWDDLGTWRALERHSTGGDHENWTRGSVVTLDAQGCVVQTTEDHLVATAGLDDLVIVHTPRATLVVRKDDEEGLRRLVRQIEEQGYERFL